MTETLEETFTEMVEGPVLTTSTEAVPKRKKRQKLGPEHAEMIVEGVKKRVAEILAESEARMALVEAAPGADARTGGRSEAGDVFTRNRAAVHAAAGPARPAPRPGRRRSSCSGPLSSPARSTIRSSRHTGGSGKRTAPAAGAITSATTNESPRTGTMRSGPPALERDGRDRARRACA